MINLAAELSIITKAGDDDHGFYPAMCLSSNESLHMFTDRTAAGMLLAKKAEEIRGPARDIKDQLHTTNAGAEFRTRKSTFMEVFFFNGGYNL